MKKITEKRFTVHIVWLNYDKTEGEITLKDNGQPLLECDCVEDVQMVKDLLNELHEEVMDLRRENTKFKLIVSEIIEDMQKYVDDNQLVYINQSYVDWIKKEVDTTLYSQKR